MKICADCKLNKELSSFCKDNKRKDGLYPYCAECRKEHRKNFVRTPARLEYERVWELKNKETRKAQKAASEKTSKRKEYRKLWKQNNLGKTRAYCMNYYTTKLQRTPKWLTESDWIEINWAYNIAVQKTKETGIPYEVDHIIPLQGENVSGLHVPWNLQIITESENCSKGNKF